MSTGAFDFQPTSYTLNKPVQFILTGTGFTRTTWVTLAEQTLGGLTWTRPSGYGTPNADGTRLTFTSTPSRGSPPPPIPPIGAEPVEDFGLTDTLQGDLLVTANDWFGGIFPYNFRSLVKHALYLSH